MLVRKMLLFHELLQMGFLLKEFRRKSVGVKCCVAIATAGRPPRKEVGSLGSQKDFVTFTLIPKIA